MSNLISEYAVSMTSREVAELTGKQHFSVMRDIRTMLSQLHGGAPEDYSPEKILGIQQNTILSSGVSARQYGSNNAGLPVYEYVLDRDAAYCLVAGYDANSRMRIIKRWQELEARQAPALPPMTPSQIGKQCILDMMDVATLFGTPQPYAIQVAASEAVRQTGMPWDRLLTQAAAMSNIPDEDVMLEPTELGKLFDLSAIAMNQKPAELGL